MNDTFFLSNMCPQVGEGFNRDYWAHLEDFCRRLTTRYPSVRIITGPLYLPKRDAADGKWRVTYEGTFLPKAGYLTASLCHFIPPRDAAIRGPCSRHVH